MGYMNAIGMAEQDISLEMAIGWHLGSNHFPPVAFMSVACIEAVEAARRGEWDRQVVLPEGVTYRDAPTASVSALVEGYHLEPWCEEEL